jgi:predicted kinase
MVRAKVALIQGQAADFSRYLSLSETYARERTRGLLLTHGLSGSGKSTITRKLAPAIEALIVRSDVERKRQLSGVYADLYGSTATRQTYALLANAAQAIISAGYHAIIDATFLKQEQRQTFIELARRLDCPCLILDFQAPRELLEQWIRERLQDGHDVSDANLAVLEQQIRTQQPLTKAEQHYVMTIDTSRDVDIAALAQAVETRIG